MPATRRTLLLGTLLSPGFAMGLAPSLAAAQGALTERSIGRPDAPVTVVEYFSLTCPHCARFARDTLPKIQTELIDTGKLRYVFADYPLDQVALAAAQVARALPPARYEPFVLALLSSQDRWAFARDIKPVEELAKMAALAGLSRTAFDAALADAASRDAILAGQQHAETAFGVDSTPTFIFNGPNAHDRRESGELTYETFAKIVSEVAGTTG